jgi:predicted dienelactone hydrolase
MTVSNAISQMVSHLSVSLAAAALLYLPAARCEQDPEAAAYDPLAVPDKPEIRQLEVSVEDSERKREIPLRIYLPETDGPAPVVLFSHGLGGTRNGCVYLGEHWAARGYVGVFLQHPGSDDSVWRDQPPAKRLGAMNDAASGRNFMLRVKDVPAVLDQLAEWNRTEEHALQGRLDMTRIGMSGHSFGAVTTQAVSGQAYGRREQTWFTDTRIRAAIAFSPSCPRKGDPETAFGSVAIPWMLMTGTHDTAHIGDQTVESRLTVYPNLPPKDKYEVVLFEAEHSAFTDRALPGDTKQRNPNHHRAILALSTAFWDAYLKDDRKALQWLQGDGPKTVLEPKDRWQHK